LYRDLPWRALALLVTLIATALIASTWAVETHTIDEPVHIACGLEWWQKGSYTYENQHPPLSRIAVAFGPWLLNAKPAQDKWGFDIYGQTASYDALLTAARAGVLPFFPLLCFGVWTWTRRLAGPRAAFLAVLLTCLNPIVLGHSSLATTDLVLTAMLLLSCAAWSAWIRRPAILTAIPLGLAIGFGLASKLTFLLFFPLCALAILACERPRLSWRDLPSLMLTIAIALIALWSTFRFQVDPYPLHGFANAIVEVRYHNLEGHQSYLLGEARRFGWWYFFPLVLLLKSPLALLTPAILSARHVQWPLRPQLAPLLCAVAMLLAVVPSHLNIGIRHILPIFPLLAIAAAFTMDDWLAIQPELTRWKPLLVFALGAWLVIDLARAWPGYIAYFNPLARGAPEKIRVDSDLDWGQGVKELARWQKAKGLTEPIGFYFFAGSDPVRHGVNWRAISPWTPSTGWIAVSATALKMCREEPPKGESRPAWWWLRGLEPAARVGGNVIFFVSKDRRASAT
jgi:4-amino-4-deoxy-L-arabinose transferase-like glycosyltransferase